MIAVKRFVQINQAGRQMVPLVCPLNFVQGFRCSQCPWGRLLAECHTPWAVPFCSLRKAAEEFDRHRCLQASDLLPVFQ
jgi:hypothetical protein